jgi:hypothetical protein
MQTTSRHFRPDGQGFALTMTLVFLAVALLVFVSILAWTSTNATVTQRNNQYNMSQNAAEAAVERIIGQIDRDFIASSISNSSAYTSLVAGLNGIDQSAWPVQYIYRDTNGNANMAGVIFGPAATASQPLNSQYAGLYGFAQSIDVYATATPTGQRYNVPATVHEALQFANIPLYQFAIFYNVNLEIDPGAAMNISGPVFCNQGIWEGSTVCTFSSTVTAVNTNSVGVPNPFALNYNGTGASIFSMAGQPVDHANALVMPIGTNNSPGAILGLLRLPPSDYAMGTSAAYSSNGMAYPANAADLVITNFACGTNDGIYTPTGTNLILYFQDSSLAQVPYDFYILTNRGLNSVKTTNYVASAFATNVIFAGFSWVTNAAFYDWREGWNTNGNPAKRVEAVQIDVAKLNTWLTNQSVPSSASGYSYDQTKVLRGHHIGSVYVYNNAALTTAQMPAVRVVNGAQLPAPGGSTYGFTVATPFPMYVQGNYNSQNNGLSALGLYGTNNATTNTLPAALMADSITILSPNWNDLNSNATNSYTCTHAGPAPNSSTVNAAMLEGIVQSDPTISGDYSGGVENFLRLLENWSGNTLTYNGSIVVLFYSQCATNHWRQTGNYYNPPTRHWAFDMNFTQCSKLPPLTPQIKAMIRGNWRIQ